MSRNKKNQNIRDSTKLMKDFNEKNVDSLDINTLEHQKDFKSKRISENTRFNDKREDKKSKLIQGDEHTNNSKRRFTQNMRKQIQEESVNDDFTNNESKSFNEERTRKLKSRVYQDNTESMSEVYDPLSKDLDNDGVIDKYDNNIGDSDYYSSTYDVEKENPSKSISKTKNKRKNYQFNEIFTRDKDKNHSQKVEEILEKSKESRLKDSLDDIGSEIPSKDKKLRKLKHKKDSLLEKDIKENPLKKTNKKMLGAVASSSSLLSTYVSHGSNENVGAEGSEKSLDKVSEASRTIGRHSRNKKSKLVKTRQKKESKLNHRIRKRKSSLEYKEKLSVLAKSDNYKQKTFVQKLAQRRKMKKLIYQKYEITFKDKVKKKLKDILLGSAKLVSSNAKKIGGGLIAALILFMMIFQLISSLGGVMSSSTNSVLTTSYLSDESVLSNINQEYSNLEYNLQDELDSIEKNYPNYDEYIINADTISHNVHELLAYITARYGVVENVSSVRNDILNLFNEVYKLDYTEEIEIRYRTEYYTYTDENGDEVEESVEVPYEYKKLIATLVKKDMDNIIRGKFNAYPDNLWHYETLLETKGNMELVFGNGGDYSEIINNPNFENPGIAYDDATIRQLFNEAEKHIGKRYVFGANGPANFDCSSFVCWAYTHSGIKNMPRTTAWGIYTSYTNPVSPSEAKAGDIIFFKNTYNAGSPISHVGIYAGNGMMLHAGDPIQYTSINSPYW